MSKKAKITSSENLAREKKPSEMMSKLKKYLRKHINLRTTIHFLLFIGFASCFLVQVHDQFIKFINKETTTVFETGKDDNLRLPAYSFCPKAAFRRDKMRELGMEGHYWQEIYQKHPSAHTEKWKIPDNVEQMQHWYDQSTYSLDELLILARYWMGNGTVVDIFANGKLHEDPEVAKSVQIISNTIYGKCILVHPTMKVSNKADYLHLSFNLSNDKDTIKAYVFARGLELFGARNDYWVGNFKMYEIVRGQKFNLDVIKKVKMLNPQTSGCQETIMYSDYGQCLLDRGRELYTELGRECPVCYLPQLELWNAQNLPTCKSLSQAQCSYMAQRRSMFGANAGAQCLLPCHTEEYSYSFRTSPMLDTENKDNLDFFTYYNVIDVEVSREHMLYDLNTIVAAVGGSMGLFLGFSFYEFAVKALYWIDKMSVMPSIE